MAPRSLALFVALATVVAVAAAEPPSPRLIDFNPWAWLPTSRNRSPSIMDYFFPPSRTPKLSNLEPPADRTPPEISTSTTVLDKTTTPGIPPLSTSRKVISTVTANGKSKPTIPFTQSSSSISTATPVTKIKKTSSKSSPPPDTTVDLKTTQPLKPEKPSSLPATSTKVFAETTSKPTKRYTIHPVRTTEKTTIQETDTTLDVSSESTETMSDMTDSDETIGTTLAGPKETPALTTVAESRATDGSTPEAATGTQPPDVTAAEGADSREGYLPLRDKPQQTHVKINDQTKKESVPLPAGSTSVLAKPTKYHYYPHNQHLYLLPECAIQQVCNAVYVRLNYTQPLCACPARYRDPCSASLNADDLHTTRLTTDSKKKFANKAVTLVKTCEAVSEMRECRAPRDWSLLALQNIRTGKSHYLVICRCPENHILEGPMSHDQPTYASVPGIRVYGMMCVRPPTYQTAGYNANRYPVQSTTSGYKVDYSQPHYNPDKPIYNRFTSHPGYMGPSYYNRMSRVARVRRMARDYPPLPWYKIREFARSLHWSQ